MIELSSAEQMKDIDARCGIDSKELMQNAAECLFERINYAKKEYLFSLDNTIIVCGTGNNGGDGYALAILLKDSGCNVRIVAADRPSTRDALYYFALCEDAQILITYADDYDMAQGLILNATFIVDAIFGIGLSRDILQPYDDLINDINDSEAFVFSIDLPSGIDCDLASYTTADNKPMCVRADITSTFVMKKPALVSYPAKDFCGDVYVEDIGIPPEIISDEDFRFFSPEKSLIKQVFTQREDNSNKGTFGTLMCFCGSKNMPGAAALCALSASRGGAGLVVCASSEPCINTLKNKLNFPVFLPLPTSLDGEIENLAADTIISYGKYNAMVIGCGLGTSEHVSENVSSLLKTDVPVVLDADGINAVLNNLDILKQRKEATVLTPHPGEMARLINCSVDYVQQNRIKAAKEFSAEYNVTLVLKGACSIVASPDGRVFINTSGTPAMAKGGMGDVLSGMIGAAIMQGQDVFNACAACVYIHGLAGELGEKKFSQYGLLPDDMPKFMCKVIKNVISHTI